MLHSPQNKRLSVASSRKRYSSQPTSDSIDTTRGIFPSFEEDVSTYDSIGDEEEFEEFLAPEDINFLRDFVINSAVYVEQLENEICEYSDDFWEAREHAYRIVTGLLIDVYQSEITE